MSSGYPAQSSSGCDPSASGTGFHPGIPLMPVMGDVSGALPPFAANAASMASMNPSGAVGVPALLPATFPSPHGVALPPNFDLGLSMNIPPTAAVAAASPWAAVGLQHLLPNFFGLQQFAPQHGLEANSQQLQSSPSNGLPQPPLFPQTANPFHQFSMATASVGLTTTGAGGAVVRPSTPIANAAAAISDINAAATAVAAVAGAFPVLSGQAPALPNSSSSSEVNKGLLPSQGYSLPSYSGQAPSLSAASSTPFLHVPMFPPSASAMIGFPMNSGLLNSQQQQQQQGFVAGNNFSGTYFQPFSSSASLRVQDPISQAQSTVATQHEERQRQIQPQPQRPSSASVGLFSPSTGQRIQRKRPATADTGSTTNSQSDPVVSSNKRSLRDGGDDIDGISSAPGAVSFGDAVRRQQMQASVATSPPSSWGTHRQCLPNTSNAQASQPSASLQETQLEHRVRDQGTSGQPSSAHDAAENGEDDVARRMERNSREQQRSQRIADQIKDLRAILSQSKIVYKPTKFSILRGVTEYIERLMCSLRQLDEENQKLHDVIAYATHVANSGEETPFGNSNVNDSVGGLRDVQGPSSTTDTFSAPQEKSGPVDYKLIFQNCQIAIGVAALDGTFIDCNPEFARLSRFTKDEIVQQSLFHFMRSLDMANLFKAMGEMLRDCTVSGHQQGHTTGTQGEEHVSTEVPMFWNGAVFPHHETNADFQLLMTITLTKTASGSPLFFNCVLSHMSWDESVRSET